MHRCWINFTICVVTLATLFICIVPTSVESRPSRNIARQRGSKFHENTSVTSQSTVMRSFCTQMFLLEWYITGSTVTARIWGSGSVLLDGTVLFCGGVGGDGYVYF